jgi:hypothetical protein
MSNRFAKDTDSDLANAFALVAAEHGDFMAAREPRKANARFDKMAKIYIELRRRGAEAQRQLLPLLRSDNPHVRFWAASYALDFEPAQGIQSIRFLEKEPGTLGASAKMTIRQWQKGDLNFAWLESFQSSK